jgi:ADP-ribosyl-[dinitrogen reductase] hydrolase
MPLDLVARARGCLLGLACGDAVGTTVEFSPRGSFPPVTDMTGGGPFRLPVGAWTDDTSMALCLAVSLVEKGDFDPADQMDRYCRWHRDGYLSSVGRCFDIGTTTRAALEAFRRTGDPYSGSNHPGSAGNGCLMRLAPVPIRYHDDLDLALQRSADSSRTTHGADECLQASRLLGAMLVRALNGATKEEILFRHDPRGYSAPKVAAIAAGEYRDKPESRIHGSGYVVECLEASAWCFWKASDFRDAILRAVNLGDDADTTGAVCGQLAGAFYGEPGIPADWLNKLVQRHEIGDLAERLVRRSG